MTAIPRILRELPRDAVITPDRPIAVWAGLRWNRGNGWGDPEPTEAECIAWAGSAVKVQWIFQGEPRTDWIDGSYVRRR